MIITMLDTIYVFMIYIFQVCRESDFFVRKDNEFRNKGFFFDICNDNYFDNALYSFNAQ